MALPVCCTAHIAIALLGCTHSHVQSRGCAATGVQHKDGGGTSRARALIRIDPVQAPSRRFWALHLWDHVDSLVGLHILVNSGRAVDDCLEVLLGAAHLQEWHTTLAGMTGQLAAVWGGLAAHALDLLV